jgi:hypothetical protein
MDLRRVATAVEVIVMGSNIPTSEETGPNPVETYLAGQKPKDGRGKVRRAFAWAAFSLGSRDK